MKNTHNFLILIILILCCFQIAHTYEYFNIYFHDGTKSDAFYAIDVDSIKYSKYDHDNVEHHDWKVQEIWTAHGVYRYLLADIDSISFNEGIKHELPIGKKAMKILAIGNSFLDDPMVYFQTIAYQSGVERSKICVYSAIRNSYSLENWATVCQSDEDIKFHLRAGSKDLPLEINTSLQQMLAQDWDVVTVQQVSSLAQDPSKLSPYLPYLVNQIRTLCPNKNVVIAFQQVWSYWKDDDNLQTSTENWQSINEVTQLTLDYGIDLIIPTGTAIQNARRTALNDPQGLTRDGVHLSSGVGRYVAACTWVEALCAPVFGVSVVGCPTNVPEVPNGTPVTEENRLQCQQCAAAAVANPYQLQ